jgi:hypothetical protein
LELLLSLTETREIWDLWNLGWKKVPDPVAKVGGTRGGTVQKNWLDAKLEYQQ